jgi:hypothetical protein
MQAKTGPFRGCAAFLLITTAQLGCRAQTTNFTVTPVADAFVRSLAPASNYGGAGALAVSGAVATNGSGQPNGLFDSLMRFPMGNLTSAMNAVFGANQWLVSGATLSVTEVGAPGNSLFNRGVGAFEIRWLASGNWLEGTGTPALPTTDGVAYQNLASLLTPGTDVSLGQFTNAGVDGELAFALPLAGALVSNITAGANLNLFVTAASPSVGFTFNSRNDNITNTRPGLQILVSPRPASRINAIDLLDPTHVSIRFNTSSDWTYTLQTAPSLLTGAAVWSNLVTVSPKPINDQAQFVDAVTNRQRLYRLFISR